MYHLLNIILIIGTLAIWGVIHSCNANRNLQQTAASQYFPDRILVQIEPATVPDNHKVDPAIVEKLNMFLYYKFSSSSRFVVLTGSKGELAGTQKKFLRVAPILTYQSEKLESGNIYYCKVDVLCRLLDLETGAHSNSGADDIQISKNCPNPIIVPRVNGQESFNLTSVDVDTMFNETFPLVWQELERKIMEKFPVNTKNAKERK